MGKHHLWRKNSNSYVRVEKDEPGCIWALFRVLNYQRWYNVRKMLTYKKQKPHEKSPKHNKGKQDAEFEIGGPLVLQGYDAMVLDFASVNSNTGKVLGELLEDNGKVLDELLEEDNSRKTSLADEGAQVHDDSAELSTPTLLSLLKADPKLDSPRKRGLARSGTFPSPNRVNNLGFGRTPSKVENKHTEIWPVMSHGNDELRKAKSLRIRRSSSLSEAFDGFGDLFDAKMSRKEVKKFSSLRAQEFTSLADHSLLRKSFRERLSLLETESHTFGSNEAPRLSLEIFNYMRGSRLDSPTDFDSPEHREKLGESQSDDIRNDENNCLVDQGKSNHQDKERQILEVASVPAPGGSAQLQQEETENAESSVAEDLEPLSESTHAANTQCFSDDHESACVEEVIEDYNEEFEYVKHVLDVLGFLGGEDQYQAWESIDETLDPTLFDEIEVLCPFKPKPSTKDSVINMPSSDRKVLFHLIIEALVEMHEKSFMYYSPSSLSFCLQINTMTKGKGRVLEEVWEFVSKYLNWGPESDLRLDVLVAHDMSKTSSVWKNNQTEIEYIGLDLEDLIFDELMEEILVEDC